MLAFTVRNRKLIAVTKRIPKLRPGWALVRVRLAGICNTDVEILRGYHAFRGTPGHEFVGEVAEVHGVSVRETSKWLGRRVGGESTSLARRMDFAQFAIFAVTASRGIASGARF